MVAVFEYGCFLVMAIYIVLAAIAAATILMIGCLRFKKVIGLTKGLNISDLVQSDGISIVVPAYNEESTIVGSIESLMKVDYPNFEIIVVNDGSEDGTLHRIIDDYGLEKTDLSYSEKIICKPIIDIYSSLEFPGLTVVDKISGGKADALNVGINVSKKEYFCAVDADCVIEIDSLKRLMAPFIRYPNTIASGGCVRVVNSCKIDDVTMNTSVVPKNPFEIFQILEYFRVFLITKVGMDALNAIPIISGAFGLFKKSVVIEAGGYKKTVGEDMELTLRLHDFCKKNNMDYGIRYVSDSVCWTQVPSNLRDLMTQRIRWHKGLVDSMIAHRKMIFNHKFGYLGMFSLPYLFFYEMLQPILEMLGLVFIAVVFLLKIPVDVSLLSGVILASLLAGVTFSLSAVLFEQSSYRKNTSAGVVPLFILFSFIEQVTYRPLNACWRLKALIEYRRSSGEWGIIGRKKFNYVVGSASGEKDVASERKINV